MAWAWSRAEGTLAGRPEDARAGGVEELDGAVYRTIKQSAFLYRDGSKRVLVWILNYPICHFMVAA